MRNCVQVTHVRVVSLRKVPGILRRNGRDEKRRRRARGAGHDVRTGRQNDEGPEPRLRTLCALGEVWRTRGEGTEHRDFASDRGRTTDEKEPRLGGRAGLFQRRSSVETGSTIRPGQPSCNSKKCGFESEHGNRQLLRGGCVDVGAASSPRFARGARTLVRRQGKFEMIQP